MKDESNSNLKHVVQEFVSEKITDKELYVDGKNYFEWLKTLDIYVKRWGAHICEKMGKEASFDQVSS